MRPQPENTIPSRQTRVAMLKSEGRKARSVPTSEGVSLSVLRRRCKRRADKPAKQACRSEPLDDGDPDDDEECSQKAWDARRLHGDTQ